MNDLFKVVLTQILDETLFIGGNISTFDTGNVFGPLFSNI